jgi:DNA-directed RNA polymerase beta' subunit
MSTAKSQKQTALPVKVFSSHPGALVEQPSLQFIQTESYKWFIEKGLRELFDEVSPIQDYSGKELELYFLDYHLDEPKHSEEEARFRGTTYDAPLRVRVRLLNKVTGRKKEQEIYLGDVPVMTGKGTFIVSGHERVVISQLIRSPGVYFKDNLYRGRRLFGAKVIPNRGTWLELETDPDKSIGVKIDRHRKVPVTSLLRVFGFEQEEIARTFGEGIEPTLKKDQAKTLGDSYLEIYRRIRPGDLATPEDAKKLVDSMLFQKERYDLSEVGRFKINQRLGLNLKTGLLTKDDIGAIIKEILRLNITPLAVADDIDDLENRRVRPMGEFLKDRLRVGFARIRRIAQDRMSTTDVAEVTPTALVNPRPLIAVIKEFFASSQMSQFMDQVNPLAAVEHKRIVTTLGPGGLTRERAGIEVRDVHSSYYGRICPIHTPEGQNIGLVNRLSNFARLDDHGFLITPYAEVKDGKTTGKIVWLDAGQEKKYKIASANTPMDSSGNITESQAEARIEGGPGTCRSKDLDFVEVAPQQLVSVASSLIPFLEHDDANRALMASNMQKQAVPSIKPEAPYVGTGIENKVARDSGYLIVAEAAGEVAEIDAERIVIKQENGRKKLYPLSNFKMSNQYMAVSHRPLVARGQRVKRGDILADGQSTDNGTLALGQNLVVAFLSWEGANFEDAVVLSEKVQRDGLFSSIHIEDFYTDVRDTKLGPELTTCDIPNAPEPMLANLDEEGIIRVGAPVEGGDILVGKISPKGESELTPEERLLRAIFGEKARDVKDSSLVLPHGKKGRVVGVKVFSRDKGDKLEPGVISRIHVEIATIKNIQAGDKMAGRHGNKGVVSQIRPVEDMPYLEDGTPVDVILNPLGVASRMNIGQVFEAHLGWAAKKLGYRAETPVFSGAKEEQIKEELKKAGIPEDGQVMLYDGRTGKPFDRKVTVGVMYMLKLNHLVTDKIHMRSIGPYSLITQQPLGGKAQLGGQRFGEMEVWALEGHGAAHTLQEMSTVKSDDVVGRSSVYESIIRGEKIKKPSVPAAFNVMVNELKALGLSVERVRGRDGGARGASRQEFDALKLKIASPEDILNWSYGEVTKPETINYRTQRPEKDGLFSERIFGPTKDWECYCGKYRKVRFKGVVCDKCGVEVTRSIVRRERMGHISLAAPVVHTWFLRSTPSRIGLLLDESLQKIEKVVYYAAYMVTGVDEEKRKIALNEVDKELRSKSSKEDSKKTELKSAANEAREFLNSLRPGRVVGEREFANFGRRFGNVFTVGAGGEGVREVLAGIDLLKEAKKIEKEISETKDTTRTRKLLRRLKLVRSMNNSAIRPEWTVLTQLPIIPPDLRPMVALDGGRYATSDLNDLYRRVINRNNRLRKLMDLNAPDVIMINEKRMLQEAVDALIDNARSTTRQVAGAKRPLRSLSDMLRGKQGRFRQNLLGKRVDYSGRSVIVVGPDLALDECGVPKIMALELFRPFVIQKIIERGLAHNIKMANRLIEQAPPEVWEILEEVIANRKVLLNRAPTLHRLSIQAFKPVLIEDLSVRVPPMVCAAFNADFDGDQMAVHLPLSDEAQVESSILMLSSLNLLKPASGDAITIPSQDIVLGCFYLTKPVGGTKGEGGVFADEDELKLAYESGEVAINALIKLRQKDGIIETTCGRAIFNQALPADFPYVNDTLSKKRLGELVGRLIDKYGSQSTAGILDRIKSVGFDFATQSGVTWGMDDLIVPKQKGEILREAEEKIAEINKHFREGLLSEDERKMRTVDVWTDVFVKIKELVPKTLPENGSVRVIVDSEARGTWNPINQMSGIKGIVRNPRGEDIELPIRSSLKEGHNSLEYFIATHGSRKGLADTALKTAEAGYLTRRLVDVAQDVVVREEDCKTTRGVVVGRTEGEGFGYKVFSRVALNDIKEGRKVVVKAGEVISREAAREIEKSAISEVEVRSPMTCNTLYGICSKCYGLDLGNMGLIKVGEAVGIVAAQSIGELGTQLTLRTFHSGGVAGEDITTGLPRVDELFEARSPKWKAVVSKTDGWVEKIDRSSGTATVVRVRRRLANGKKGKEIEYPIIGSRKILVSEGDRVNPGEPLSEGNLDPKDILAYGNKEETYRYILKEVQGVYISNGSTVHDKHMDIIIRQMFSRVRIVDPGDTDFVVGEIVDKSRFREVNKELRGTDKETAKGEEILLGITRAALSADGFLAPASFQETARVLIRAASEGRVDYLRGLKENVIIGRLVPVGTAIRGDVGAEEDELVEVEGAREDERPGS